MSSACFACCLFELDQFRSQRLRAFHESGQHVYLATGFDFREKRSCWLWVDRRPDFAVGLLHSHTMKERRRRLFSLKSRAKKTTRRKVNSIDFYFHFPANFSKFTHVVKPLRDTQNETGVFYHLPEKAVGRQL